MVNLVNSVAGNISLTQGTSTVIAPSLDLLNGLNSINGVTVRIASNFVSAEDRLGIVGQLGDSGSLANGAIQWSYSNGLLSFTGLASEAVYEEALRNVVYTNTGGTSSKAVEISVSRADFNPTTGSFYQYISAEGANFTTAQTAAAAQTFLGINGYLATITSAEEQAIVEALLQGNAWIGASAGGDNSWSWITEPGGAIQFWTGGPRPVGIPNGYDNWLASEPNNPDTKYAVMLGAGPDKGKWFDEGIGGGFGFYATNGYLIEYSGFQETLSIGIQVTAPNPVDPDPVDPVGPVDPVNPGPIPLFSFNNGLLETQGTTQSTGATISLSNFKAKTVLEVGYFKADDASGKVNGLAPGSQGYLEAVLGRAQTVFSTPDGADFGNLALNRSLSFNQDGFFSFFVVEEGTIDGLKRGGAGKVTFGNQLKNGKLPLSIDSQTNQFTVKWDLDNNPGTSELVFNFQPSAQGRPVGSGLQGGAESEVLDLRGIQGTAKATAEIRREAKYNNEVGFFAVENTQGQIRDEFGNLLNPGDQGYLKAAVRQWATRSGLTGQNNRVVNSSFELEGGKIWAPFIVSNGNIAQLLDSDASNDPQVFFPYLGANPGKTDHIRLLGDNTFGFEDQIGGGDRDYDDMIVKITIS